ncbi:hypothetical protein M3Y97_00556500 [Aphelenchoides bicaudatus]|nr:hypothetical protein M3Y97_00556500 [Aphelenchoides bicaudatus]
MRLILRLSLLGSLAVVFLILYAIRSSRHSALTLEQQETDEAIRLLLATGEDAQANAGLQQAVSSNTNANGVRPTTELTFNVAVVLVVSLLSVALLITGIIIVAVTLNPGGESSNYHSYVSNQNSYDSDQEPTYRHRRKLSVDYDCDDSGGEFGPNDLCADAKLDSFQWDAEAQIWSSTA